MNKNKVTYKELTAEEWLKKKKWSNFLRAIPLDSEKTYTFVSPSELVRVKVTAYLMNSNSRCDRKFVIKNSAANLRAALFTATLKPQPND